MGMENSGYYFDPIGLFVKPGETVTWVIESGSHTSTAYSKENGTVTRIPEGATSWKSGFLNKQGATFEHTFEVKGTYDYFCLPHKSMGMIGRLVVDEPGGPAEGSMPPDGKLPESSSIVEQNSIAYEDFMG
jgi:plastocyanin